MTHGCKPWEWGADNGGLERGRAVRESCAMFARKVESVMKRYNLSYDTMAAIFQ